ncbi:hypothetical protein IC235_13130 [Hymenobacter sp. BT664]|uniref:Uncharacterized protein n=1 Tax=Hymenobacter montanus TaxID=2771359 RepID=A0A927BDI4_9BACT|nr:hypothetical protein [Hymenobacter montanus]MBD2768832.1 hypothetical protein [Hymenobacter montanus]
MLTLLIVVIKLFALSEQFRTLIILTMMTLIVITALSCMAIIYINRYYKNQAPSKFIKLFLTVQEFTTRAIFPILMSVVQAMLIFNHSL